MAAFDLNSLYFLKNAAPKAASFEELNAPTERGFNLGRAYNENYNRNSLQNLIAQREKEGVPYDRLSNEAAKWDLGAAQAMRNERRSSLEYNYKQSVAEFEQWRRNMARRICGLILQKADELGIAPEELDRVLNVAASYVVTYDEALAQWLLGQAGTRRAAQNRLRPKDKVFKDDHVVMFNGKDRILNFSQGTEGTPEQRKVAAAEYSRLNMLESYLGGRYPMYTWMTGYLRGVANDGGTYEQAIQNIINAYDETQPAGFEYRSLKRYPEYENDPTIASIIGSGDANVNGATNNGTVQNASGKTAPAQSAVNGSGNGKSYKYVVRKGDSLGGAIYPLDNAIQQMGKDVSAVDNKQDAEMLLAAIEEYESVPKAKGVESLKQRLKDKITKFEDLEKGGYSQETAKVLKLADKSGAEQTAEVARWNRIPTIIEGYYQSAGAMMAPLVRALLPEERTTDEDVKRILVSDLGDDGFDRLKNAVAASDKNILGNLLKQEAFEQAVRNVAPIALKKMKNEYESLVNENGKAKVDAALREAYKFNDKVIKYLDGTLELQTNKDRYKAIQKKLKDEREVQEKSAYEREMGKSSSGTISAEEWLKQNGGL